MKNNASESCSLRPLTQITPIVRGLLANSTGNEDMPYEPVILKSMTDREAIVFAGKKNGGLKPTLQSLPKSARPPLFIDIAEESADPEKLRETIK